MSAIDMSEDDGGALSARDWQDLDAPSPMASVKSDSEAEDDVASSAPSQPIQKRRRVTRACDECRRKKIKCDGKQPCTHCSVYSYECTYDKPSNRRRNPAPQYIEALEGRLQRAEALLRKFLPDVDLTDPNLDPTIQQEFFNREQARTAKQQQDHMPIPGLNEAQLTSMIDSIGQLDIDEKGGWDFHGISSGAVFLKRMRENFRGMMGPASKAPFLPRAEKLSGLLDLDTPSPSANSPHLAASNYADLPTKNIARNLCYYTLSCATCLVRIVHVPSFYEKFERIYDRPIESLNREETRFLGLIYAVLALGCMYSGLENPSTDKESYKEATQEGFKYYATARALLQDVTECRDVTSLQALLYMILFLQATANLSSCYGFVGIALRSALRIGLHRNLRHDQIGAVEQEVRRRVFYVIRQMDIYVSTLLGFPLLLNDEDIDQPYPVEVDDEFITPRGVVQPPPGQPSFFQAFNAHTRLMEILTKINKYVYPMKGLSQSFMKGDKHSSTYVIPYSRIKEIETELQNWYEQLPEAWRPSPDGPVEVVRVRHLLRFAYAHVQLVLYRPFLHYVSPRLSKGTKVDEVSYACAAAAISVSRNIVHIGLEIRKQKVLSGPYWFMLFTEYFAVLSLVFYAIENPDKPGSPEVLLDARAGRQMIADLADKSMSADRVTKSLKVLFDQLPENLEQARPPRQTQNKKRQATAAKAGTGSGPQSMRSPSVASSRNEELARARGMAPSSRSFSTPLTQGMDCLPQVSEAGFTGSNYSAEIQDLYSLEIPSRATPDSTSTGGSVRNPYASHPLSASNSMRRIDNVMFPSGNPFEYPNQPMMGLDFDTKTDMPPVPMDGHAHEAFSWSGVLEDLDPQMLGQPPPYAMHQQQNPASMGLAPNMYDTSMMGVQMTQPTPQLQQRQVHTQRNQGGPSVSLSQARRVQQARQEKQIDQLFTEQGMQPDWGSFFGSGRGGFQGM